jgi:hypothetical protein
MWPKRRGEIVHWTRHLHPEVHASAYLFFLTFCSGELIFLFSLFSIFSFLALSRFLTRSALWLLCDERVRVDGNYASFSCCLCIWLFDAIRLAHTGVRLVVRRLWCLWLRCKQKEIFVDNLIYLAPGWTLFFWVWLSSFKKHEGFLVIFLYSYRYKFCILIKSKGNYPGNVESWTKTDVSSDTHAYAQKTTPRAYNRRADTTMVIYGAAALTSMSRATNMLMALPSKSSYSRE